MSRVAAIILAAGRGTRYAAAGGAEASKLVARYRGEPLLRYAARAALASAADPVIVVTGHARPEVAAALDGLEVRLVHNGLHRDGLALSLRCGLAALPADIEGTLILLGDMPAIDVGTIDALIQRFGEAPLVDAVVPVHGGMTGNPVLLSRSLFPRLRSLTGDEGARRLLKDPLLRVTQIDRPPSVLLDIDRPDDLLRAENFPGSSEATPT